MAKYIDLEKRIAGLEKILGLSVYSSNKALPSSIDIQSTVSKMEQKLSFIYYQKL